MFKSQIEEDLKNTIAELGFLPVKIDLSIPENSQFGDYSTNIGLQLSKQAIKNSYHSSQEIANAIIEKLSHPAYLERVEAAGPGFINFFIKDDFLARVLEENLKKKHSTDRVIVEYADPNTHKDFHIGHVRPLVFGESVARLYEYRGAKVFRANYGSDIGPTVAKTLWGIGKMADEFKEVKEKGSLREKAAFLGKAYTAGHKDYVGDPAAKEAIDSLAKKLYARDPEIVPVWEETRGWSLAYFDTIYSRFGIEFDRRINESEVEAQGKKIVEENIGQIFTKDQGAIIFPGEKYGLHTRVFITSAGNPTYEAKELGLTQKYQEIFPFDELVILSDNPQAGFFKVTIKAVELLDSRLTGKKRHLGFGSINLTTGRMSSRLGNLISAEELLEKTSEELEKVHGKADPGVAIGAIKFAILKYSLQTDIVYNPKESVSIQGDSGPYLQYTFARTRSVLEKAASPVIPAPDKQSLKLRFQVRGKLRQGIQNADGSRIKSGMTRGELEDDSAKLTEEEREVLKQIEYMELIFDKASKELEPSQICYYLLNLAKSFNFFYQRCPIIKSERESIRLSITRKVGDILSDGLYLLGIEAPEKM